MPCKWQSVTAVTAAVFQTRLAIERDVRGFIFGVNAEELAFLVDEEQNRISLAELDFKLACE